MLLLYGVNSSAFSSTNKPLYLRPVYINFQYPSSLYLLAWQPKLQTEYVVVRAPAETFSNMSLIPVTPILDCNFPFPFVLLKSCYYIMEVEHKEAMTAKDLKK